MSTTDGPTSHHQAKLSLTQSTQTPPATWDEGEKSWRWGEDNDFESFWTLDKSKIKHVISINTWGKCYPVVRVAHPREGPARQLTIQWRLLRNFGLYATELHWVMKYMFLIRCWVPLSPPISPDNRTPSCSFRIRPPPLLVSRQRWRGCSSRQNQPVTNLINI